VKECNKEGNVLKEPGTGDKAVRMALNDNPGFAMALPDEADTAIPEAGIKAGTK
jgi:hypothetical protein